MSQKKYYEAIFSSRQIPEAVKRSEPASEWVAAWLSFIKADIMDLRYMQTVYPSPKTMPLESYREQGEG